jgi:hypothetical protein
MSDACCNGVLQTALTLILDLAELICYSRTALRKEGSGPTGKFATGSMRSLRAFGDGRLSGLAMANLPFARRRNTTIGMMPLHHSAFFC